MNFNDNTTMNDREFIRPYIHNRTGQPLPSCLRYESNLLINVEMDDEVRGLNVEFASPADAWRGSKARFVQFILHPFYSRRDGH